MQSLSLKIELILERLFCLKRKKSFSTFATYKINTSLKNRKKNYFKLCKKSKLFRNGLYTWKNNLENNEKFIKMSLNLNKDINLEQRNILGITKSP